MIRLLVLAMGLAAAPAVLAQSPKQLEKNERKTDAITQREARREERKKAGQDSRKEAERRRKKQKTQQNEQDSILFLMAERALDRLDFVVEADQLIFRQGRSAFVSSTRNFIALHNNRAVVQVAPFNGGGPNGVGGITVEGSASSINKSVDKRGNIYFTMNVSGNGISALVSIALSKGSNNVSATINPNFNANRITLNGILIPTAESRIFKGTPL